MKKKRILGALFAAILIFTCAVPQTVNAASWQHDSSGWWYQYDNGSYPKNQWKYINGHYYWFDSNGYMATYWRVVGGKWHYFGADGAERYGWLKLGSTWYYLDENGEMQTNWQKIDGSWYLFDGSGAMVTQWKSVYGAWYYFGSDGAMRTGWASVGGTWYHFDENGIMETEWTYVDGEWYYLGSNGAMYGGGWHYISGAWYYMYSSGVMARNTWIGDYFVNGSGVMVDASQGVYLLDVMKPYITPGDYYEYTNKTFAMGGDYYTNGFACRSGYERATYFNVAGKYKKISFILGSLDNNQIETTGTEVRILADGKQVASFETKRGDLPKACEASINNCKQLQIVVQCKEYMGGMVGIAELKVKR